jgi:hypothetical protein
MAKSEPETPKNTSPSKIPTLPRIYSRQSWPGGLFSPTKQNKEPKHESQYTLSTSGAK